MQQLAAAYEKACGKKAAFLTARGVTYAKAFGGRGVAGRWKTLLHALQRRHAVFPDEDAAVPQDGGAAQGAVIVQIPVRHHARLAGTSKYTNLGRLKTTWADLLGVRWMLARTRAWPAVAACLDAPERHR